MGRWSITHWTPFNELASGEASSPGYRHALERQQAAPSLPYGMEVSHDGIKVLGILWADDGGLGGDQLSSWTLGGRRAQPVSRTARLSSSGDP